MGYGCIVATTKRVAEAYGKSRFNQRRDGDKQLGFLVVAARVRAEH